MKPIKIIQNEINLADTELSLIIAPLADMTKFELSLIIAQWAET